MFGVKILWKFLVVAVVLCFNLPVCVFYFLLVFGLRLNFCPDRPHLERIEKQCQEDNSSQGNLTERKSGHPLEGVSQA